MTAAFHSHFKIMHGNVFLFCFVFEQSIRTVFLLKDGFISLMALNDYG